MSVLSARSNLTLETLDHSSRWCAQERILSCACRLARLDYLVPPTMGLIWRR